MATMVSKPPFHKKRHKKSKKIKAMQKKRRLGQKRTRKPKRLLEPKMQGAKVPGPFKAINCPKEEAFKRMKWTLKKMALRLQVMPRRMRMISQICYMACLRQPAYGSHNGSLQFSLYRTMMMSILSCLSGNKWTSGWNNSKSRCKQWWNMQTYKLKTLVHQIKAK